jgi:hypothetical protein
MSGEVTGGRASIALRLAAAACGVFAAWRFLYAFHTDQDPSSGGEASRQHAGLLALQVTLAGLGAVCFVAAAVALREPGRSARRAILAACLCVGGVALIFTRHGLGDFGGYES